MDFRQANCFIALIEEGSFTKAAKRLHATQPGLSVTIANLEQQFGVKLVERHPRGIAATAAGEKLYDSCLAIVREVELSRLRMAELKNTTMGNVRFGLPPTLCRGIAVNVLLSHSKAFPFVDLKMAELYSKDLAERVSSGALDFALVTKVEGVRGLKYTSMHRDRVVLTSSKRFKSRFPAQLRVKDLPPLKLILPTREQALGQTIREAMVGRDIKAEKIIEIEGMVSLLEIVRTTEWVSFLPTISLYAAPDKETLHISFFSDDLLEIEYFLVERTTAPLSRPAKQLVEIIAEEFSASKKRWPRVVPVRGRRVTRVS